ncbi:MAG: phage baseplate assembly protein V [Gemmatimonadota bacterium]
MGVLITATLGAGRVVLKNREIEHLEIRSELGEPHRCLIRFDRDTSHTENLQDLQGQLSVEIADDSILGGAKAVLFEGVMTGGDQDHQLRGGSRFEVRASSPLMLGMERNRRATFFSTTFEEATTALKLTTIGTPRFKVPTGGYRMFGETRLEFSRRLADDAGFFIIERDGQVQLRSEFDDARRRTLTFGRELLALRAHSALVNHRFRGGVYEQATKSDFRFRDQHKEPVVTGAIKLTDAVKAAASEFAGGLDPNLVMSDSRAAFRDQFRDGLLRESERTLGAAVTIDGESRDFLLRLGETIQVVDAPGFTLTGSTGVFGLVGLTHVWDSAEYRNAFTASPWKNFTNAERPALRTAPGPFLAEALATPPETLAKGFIFVRMAHMDKNEDFRIFARLVSPFAGNQRGLVFVPEPGDEVLVDFAQGDPEHAMVLGSLWNGKDGLPGIEPKQIVTKAGNVLLLHDDGFIELYTPEGKCMLQMSNQGGKPRVMLHSEGDLLLEAKGQIQLRAASLHELIGGGVKREIGGDETVTVKGQMTHSSDGMMQHDSSTGASYEGCGSLVTLMPGQARMTSVISVVEGDAMVIASGATVQLNPPIVAPKIPVIPVPKYLPGALASSHGVRKVPEPTPPFDSDQDPPPGKVT